MFKVGDRVQFNGINSSSAGLRELAKDKYRVLTIRKINKQTD